ncbi:MAG: hypothetical protein IRZ13_20465, partial [Acetobacteraceae bacterium]|nr:hypothetical protein [Acetobacteraceae bacterium]
KGEFETTEAYEARARSAQGRLSDDIAVIVPVPEHHARYNADRQEMKVSYISGEAVLATDLALGPRYDSVYHIIVSQSIRPTGTYTGANAFGRRATVVRQEGNRVGLTFPGLNSSLGWPSGYSSSGIVLRMDPEAARRAKNNFAVMFVGSLKPPFVLTGSIHRTPTIQAPFDTTINLRSLNMDPVCAVLVNRATGEVLRSLRLRS